jgi:Kef-type K+ transport system membrane component KefB
VDTVIPLEVTLAGIAIVLALLLKHAFIRLRIPSLIGFMALGLLIRIGGMEAKVLSEPVLGIFEFLGNIGLIVLLFQVGLHSNLAGLRKQLRHASFIWLGNVLFSGGLGYVAASYGLKLGLIPSLFLATALTATSVGVSIAAWQEARSLDSVNGYLLIDVAEMDDISSILLLSLLLAVLPVLKGAEKLPLSLVAAETTVLLLVKIGLFGAFCLLFSRYAEERLMSFFSRMRPAPDPMLLVAGTGLVIAGAAGWLGFSVAVGALFAGLVFSRDPRSIRDETAYGALFEFFTPFFFIDIGLRVDHASISSAAQLGLVLLLVAIIGKIIGTGLPTLLVSGWTSSVLVSLSMIPRAEIAMVVMQQGHKLGSWAVPPHVFSAMVLVSAASCLLTPLALRPLLSLWPQMREDER